MKRKTLSFKYSGECGVLIAQREAHDHQKRKREVKAKLKETEIKLVNTEKISNKRYISGDSYIKVYELLSRPE